MLILGRSAGPKFSAWQAGCGVAELDRVMTVAKHSLRSQGAAGPPPAQGLYDPKNEHDSCGVGFVADLKGRVSHKIVEDGLKILVNLTHRGAAGADPLAHGGARVDERDELEALAQAGEVGEVHRLADQAAADDGDPHALAVLRAHHIRHTAPALMRRASACVRSVRWHDGVDMRAPGTLQVR